MAHFVNHSGSPKKTRVCPLIFILILMMTCEHSCAFQSTSFPKRTARREIILKPSILLHSKKSPTILSAKKGNTRNNNDFPAKTNNNHMTSMLSAIFAVATFLGTTDAAWADTSATLDVTILDTTTASTVAAANNNNNNNNNMAATTAVDKNAAGGLNARRYWNIMASQEPEANEWRIQANEGLLDYAVGTVNTMYYDNTGGARFTSREFYNRWRTLRDESRARQQQQLQTQHASSQKTMPTTLATRTGAVESLKWLVSTLDDPFSKYLTREELYKELQNEGKDGFLGIGALVETPEQGDQFFARGSAPTLATVVPDNTVTDVARNRILSMVQVGTQRHSSSTKQSKNNAPPLSAKEVRNLPVVTAVVPDSPAERAGITVGDRIVAVGDYTFLGQSRTEVSRNFQTRFGVADTTYFGTSRVTVAKPVVRTLVTSISSPEQQGEATSSSGNNIMATTSTSAEAIISREREVVIGYRQTRVRLPTKADDEDLFASTSAATTASPDQDLTFVGSRSNSNVVSPLSMSSPPTKGGNAIVHWELISTQSPQPSIFQRSLAWASSSGDGISNEKGPSQNVGYIRLTRFSKSSTAGYVEAVEALERAGATSFIIDVRNNYGGVIQEAMLTASTLLRDPHAVLCYTLNSRGGFGPHDVEEYLVDKRYPGYLMSRESRFVTLNEARRENPDYFEDGGIRWSPPSSYASLHEQTVKRGLHRPSYVSESALDGSDLASLPWLQKNTAATKAFKGYSEQKQAQQNLIILINEGTASAAEVFASALHDNGRTLAVIGTNSYGKGLIQHSFPMPDGGALRLTVAEYLTPALRHVTVVGNAKFDPLTGEQVGGGIKPDLYCASKQGIPSNVGADFCVGTALDILEQADILNEMSRQGFEKQHHHQQPRDQQQEEDFLKSGVLAKRSGGVFGSNSASMLSVNANSWDALEQKLRGSGNMQVRLLCCLL